jgi:hypothetical protein
MTYMNQALIIIGRYSDGFTGGGGGGGGGGGCALPPSLGQRGCRGVLFFMIKQKNIRDKMRYSNFSNNMMVSEL